MTRDATGHLTMNKLIGHARSWHKHVGFRLEAEVALDEVCEFVCSTLLHNISVRSKQCCWVQRSAGNRPEGVLGCLGISLILMHICASSRNELWAAALDGSKPCV